jgi:hypothetical protein
MRTQRCEAVSPIKWVHSRERPTIVYMRHFGGTKCSTPVRVTGRYVISQFAFE